MRSTRQVRSSKRSLAIEKLELRSLFAADFVANELLIQYESDYASDFGALNVAQGAQVLQDLELTNADSRRFARVRFPAGRDLDNAVESYRRVPGVISAEYNWIVTKTAVSNDPLYANGSHWGMYSDDIPTVYGVTGTTNLFGSGAEVAWGRDIIGSEEIVIGVLDEGIDINHEDLRRNIWVNPKEVPNDGVDNDRNGFVDDVNGWDFFNKDSTVFDGNGGDTHGTHVAGTIGALGGNGIGVAGVSWNVKMLSAKFLGPGGGTISDAITAIDYMTKLKLNQGVNIVAINNSWTGGGYSAALHASIIRAANAGILFVAAAGNSFLNNDIHMTYPASYSTLVGASGQPSANYESVIAVSALNSDGSMAGYSNWGANTVDIGAPGTSIISTLPNNAYGVYSGTSMATPHVTGAIALLAANQPNLGANGIREAILSSAEPTNSLDEVTTTGGRLSIPDAIDYFSLPSLAISDASTVEGGQGEVNQLVFTVRLSAPVSEPFSVSYTTQDATAQSGSDYRASSGVLNFAIGETSKTITIDSFGDNVVEIFETFSIILLGSSTRSVRFSDPLATGTIINDDSTSVFITDVSAVENTGGMLFTVALTNPSNSTVSVRFATSNGTARAGRNADYTAASGTLTFSPGETTKTISILIRNDTAVESNEIFFVVLSNAVGTEIGTSRATGTIIDDDGGRQLQSSSGISAELLTSSDWDILLEGANTKRRLRRI